MLRIYLDQKDFSQLARGSSLGNSADMAAVDYLARLVATGHIRIYFSWVHLVETLRFRGDRLDAVDAYCRIVERLTGGHCLRFPPRIMDAELERALGLQFGFTPEHDDAYAYGEYADALGLDPEVPIVDLAELVSDDDLERMTDPGTLLGVPIDRTQFALMLDQLPDAALARFAHQASLDSPATARRLMKSLVAGSLEERRLELRGLLNSALSRQLVERIPEATLLEFGEKFPAGGFAWTRDRVQRVMSGAPDERREVWADFLRGVCHMKELVTYYSLSHPDLRSVGTAFDDSGNSLVEQIQRIQLFEPLRAAILESAPSWDRDIASSVGVRLVENFTDRITQLADDHGFPTDAAVAALKSDGFRAMPMIAGITTTLRSYLAHHKGRPPRMPLESDLRDLLHGMYAPYVDRYLTDKFSAEVSRVLSRSFQVRVLRSVAELVNELKTTYGDP
jgi:hypothetical protein